jgi:hypothetical protein
MRTVHRILVLLAATAGLAGCVAYPVGYYAPRPRYYGYYAPPPPHYYYGPRWY